MTAALPAGAGFGTAPRARAVFLASKSTNLYAKPN